MNKLALILATGLLISAGKSHATTGQDSWGDAHAKIHFIGEALIAQSVLEITDNRALAFGSSLAVGLAREEWKRQHGFSHYTANRLILDAAGAYVGSRCRVTLEDVRCSWKF